MIKTLAIMVLTMIFSFDSISQTKLNTVLYKSMIQLNYYYVVPSSITSGISRISCLCTTSYELWWNNAYPCHCHFVVLGCRQPGTPNTFASPFILLDVTVVRLYFLETFWHDVSWSSSTFWLLPSVTWMHCEKYHPCPSLICVIIDNLLWLLPIQTWSCITFSAIYTY